jgi:hypothetical protein
VPNVFDEFGSLGSSAGATVGLTGRWRGRRVKHGFEYGLAFAACAADILAALDRHF